MPVTEVVGVAVESPRDHAVRVVLPCDVVALEDDSWAHASLSWSVCAVPHPPVALVDTRPGPRPLELLVVGSDGRVSGVLSWDGPLDAVPTSAPTLGSPAPGMVGSPAPGMVAETAQAAAHDINNLLEVLSGSLTLLERRGDLKGCEPLIERMRCAIARGATISRRLLGGPSDARGSCDCVTRDDLVAFGRALDGAVRGDILVETQVDAGLGWFRADPEGLYFALLNLCRNASDAMPGGGKVLISGREMGRLPSAPDGAVEVVVADTGEGMAENVLARALEPRFSTKHPTRGSGLGLTQVRRFAERHGGAIQVGSELGVGTVVRMVFPRVAPP